MQLLCQPFHREALPCNYNRGSLNHLLAGEIPELLSLRPHEDNGQRQ